MVRVVVDSTADLPPAIRDELGIVVVPLTVQFGDESFRDGLDLSPSQFYARLAGAGPMPTTSQPAPGVFLAIYERLAAAGEPIVSIHISERLSGTIGAARQAAALLPEAQITIIDSMHTALGQGLQAIVAARAARAGQDAEAVAALVRSTTPRTFVYAGLDTLKYLERGGRIGRLRAFMGTLLSVKPILVVREGVAMPVEQVRTAKRLPQRLMELARSHGPLDELAVLYTSNPAPAEALAALCVASGLMPDARIIRAQMGPVIGTHIGTDAVGIAGIATAA